MATLQLGTQDQGILQTSPLFPTSEPPGTGAFSLGSSSLQLPTFEPQSPESLTLPLVNLNPTATDGVDVVVTSSDIRFEPPVSPSASPPTAPDSPSAIASDVASGSQGEGGEEVVAASSNELSAPLTNRIQSVLSFAPNAAQQLQQALTENTLQEDDIEPFLALVEGGVFNREAAQFILDKLTSDLLRESQPQGQWGLMTRVIREEFRELLSIGQELVGNEHAPANILRSLRYRGFAQVVLDRASLGEAPAPTPQPQPENPSQVTNRDQAAQTPPVQPTAPSGSLSTFQFAITPQQMVQSFSEIGSVEEAQRVLAALALIRERTSGADMSAYERGVEDLTTYPQNPSGAVGAYGLERGVLTPVRNQATNLAGEQPANRTFSPLVQDYVALEALRRRGVLDDIAKGEVDSFLQGASRIWSFLPPSMTAGAASEGGMDGSSFRARYEALLGS